MKQVFKARLEGRGPSGAWTFLPIPFNVEKEFGSKALVRVAGTINGSPFRNSIMPEGDGTHSMMVSKELQRNAGVSKGGLVAVVMDIDKAERKVTVPSELKTALSEAPSAKEYFEQLSYSCKKAYVDWIEGAKRQETKESRVARSIELLLKKQKLA
jgi:hypothetical protein